MMRKSGIKKALLFFLLVCLLPFAGMGCGNDKPPAEQAVTGAENAGEGGGEEGGDEGEEPVRMPQISIEMQKLPYEDITLPASDRLVINGRLYDPSQKSEEDEANTKAPAAAEEEIVKKYPLVILLHGINGNFTEWGDIPAKLVKAGYAVFAMDLRGHGKSIRYANGRKKSWRKFGIGDWNMMPRDIDSILAFFAKSEDYPQVDTRRVSLIGSSLGANVALVAASRNRPSVKAIVLLSPGLEYKGLSATPAVLYYQNPSLIIAGQEDPYASNSAETIYKWSQGPKSIRIYKDIGQGLDMMKNEPTLQQEILSWLTSKVPPTAYVPPPPPPEKEADAGAEEEKG